ncbi:hypothetical protein BDQ17DRAFT_1331005 [Cyathus striatus]|nr:hypothetical protein BDQ17DRAFT_1331005 [Cyathus striatus]
MPNDMDTATSQSIFLRNCSCLVTFMVLLYDHFSTFQFELTYIWNRYFSLLCQTTVAGTRSRIAMKCFASNHNATSIYLISEGSILLCLMVVKRYITTRIVRKVIRDGGGVFATIIGWNESTERKKGDK